MNKRVRKKWMKKNNKYVSYSDIWNLDHSISEYVVPRLKLFRDKTISYPGRGKVDTFEKWTCILNKMIKAFEMSQIDPLDAWMEINNTRLTKENKEDYYKFCEEYSNEVKEGLNLFAEYFTDLWI